MKFHSLISAAWRRAGAALLGYGVFPWPALSWLD